MAQPIETTLDQGFDEPIAQRQRGGGNQNEQRDEAQREQRRDRRHHGEMREVDGIGMPPQKSDHGQFGAGGQDRIGQRKQQGYLRAPRREQRRADQQQRAQSRCVFQFDKVI